MKATELRAKSADELNKELLELLKAQFSLRMQHATQQLGRAAGQVHVGHLAERDRAAGRRHEDLGREPRGIVAQAACMAHRHAVA